MKSVVALLMLLALATTPAVAKTLQVPKDHDTIQAAIDAAEDGDRILIKGGTYGEDVVIEDRSDLTIKGLRKPLIDKHGIRIVSSGNIMITGLTIDRSPGTGIEILDSDDVTIRKCRVFRTVDDGIAAMRSDRLRIERNILEDIQEDGIDLDYDEALQEACNEAGIRKNRITRTDSDAIEVSGYLHVLSRNRILTVGSNGIGVQETATAAIVSGNRIEDCTVNGIIARGRGAMIGKNRIRDVKNDGIGVEGDDALVEKNRISDCEDDGIDVYETDFCTIQKNRISDIDEEGIQVIDAYDGIYAKNRIRDCRDCGIIVESGTGRFEKNSIANSGHCGILMEDGGSEIVKNRVRKSVEVDIYDAGPFKVENVYEKNRYRTSNL